MPTVHLKYKKGATVPVYIGNLDRHDNDLFEKQIRESGDVQSKKTNVKAEMRKSSKRLSPCGGISYCASFLGSLRQFRC